MSGKQKERFMVHGSLDVRGESCPYPELYTLDALQSMHAGDVLEVITDCPQAFINVPESVKRHGHKVLSEVKENTTMYFYIEVQGNKESSRP